MSQMKIAFRRLLLVGLTVLMLVLLANSPVGAVDVGAIADGNWNNPATWVGNAVPSPGDNVFIGWANGVSAPSAVVTMTQDEFANQVILGNGGTASGTLDLGNYKLTLTDLLYVGYSPGSSATVLRGTGYFVTPTMEVDWGANFTYNALDRVTYLSISDNATATTAATGNVGSHITIVGGGKLTLGADMALGDYFHLQDTGSQLDMAGHSLRAQEILIGTNGSSPSVLHTGKINAAYLSVVNVNLDLIAGGAVSQFDLNNGNSAISVPVTQLNLYNGAVAATAGAGNVSGGVTVAGGSKLTLGSNMNLTGTISLEGSSSSLDMAGHTLSANQLLIGWNGGAPAVLHQGAINANHLYLANENFNMRAGDLINSGLTLSNASAITVTQANGQFTGLTFNGALASDLTLNDTSALHFDFGVNTHTHWVFRWRNPNPTSNWIANVTDMINAGQISVTPASGYAIVNQGGYTYIYIPPQPVSINWKGGAIAGPTQWELAANWDPNTTATHGPGVTLGFGEQPAANNIVQMSSTGEIVGTLLFLPGTNTTIQGSGDAKLTLDNNGGISILDVTGNHTIAAPMTLNNDAQIVGLGALTVIGDISGQHTLSVYGNLVATSIEVNSLIIGESTMTGLSSLAGVAGMNAAPVPEPSAFAMIGMWLAGMIAFAGRMKKRNEQSPGQARSSIPRLQA